MSAGLGFGGGAKQPAQPRHDAASEPRVLCPAAYEDVPSARRTDTHTCRRLVGHEGKHLCPTCHTEWERP